jgi:hypothetical protein
LAVEREVRGCDGEGEYKDAFHGYYRIRFWAALSLRFAPLRTMEGNA